MRLPVDLGPADNHRPGVDAAAIQFAVAGAKHHPAPIQAELVWSPVDCSYYMLTGPNCSILGGLTGERSRLKLLERTLACAGESEASISRVVNV